MNGAYLDEVNRKLLATAMLVAPTNAIQQAFTSMAITTPADELPEALLGTMLDGLRYGNWPDPKLV